MSSVNKQIIVGTVGTINELKGSTEMPVLSFSIATSDYVGKGKGEPNREGQPGDYATTWHDITAFGKTAGSLATKLGKGDKVYVEGSLSKETYQKKDGSGSATSARTKANQVTILFSKAGTGGQVASQPEIASVADLDIPF